MATPEQIPGVDWEDDRPSPYRRRERPVGVRRVRARLATRLLRMVFLDLLFPLFLVYGTYCCSVRAAHSSRFRFDPEADVILTGNHSVSKDRLLEALGFARAGNADALKITTLDLAAERERVEELPWVRSASIERIFPHRLEVSVVERTPVAFVNVSGRVELVDPDGAFLQTPAEATFDFPVLYGLDSLASAADRRERLALYLGFLHETQAEITGSSWTVSEADCSSPDDLRLLLVQGNQTIWVHFGDKDFRQRFRTFLSLAPRVLGNYSKIDSMDLRYHNEVVVDP